MKMYLLSLAAGLLVGMIYSLLHIRSPAPPLVALVGLLGILAGEQILPMAKVCMGIKPQHAAAQASITLSPASTPVIETDAPQTTHATAKTSEHSP
jgi:XapX domain-containing protein